MIIVFESRECENEVCHVSYQVYFARIIELHRRVNYNKLALNFKLVRNGGYITTSTRITWRYATPRTPTLDKRDPIFFGISLRWSLILRWTITFQRKSVSVTIGQIRRVSLIVHNALEVLYLSVLTREKEILWPKSRGWFSQLSRNCSNYWLKIYSEKCDNVRCNLN